MKISKIISALILASFLVVPLVGMADTRTTPPTTTNLLVTLTEYDVIKTLDNIVDWLFAIILIVAVIFLIVGAYRFVTGGGDPEKVKSARNDIMYALIGVLVAFLARGLVTLVGRMMK